MTFTVVIEYNDPADGLQDQDSWTAETVEDALQSIAAARNLDCYVNPIGYVYDASGDRVA
jgi:hypothetical protein